MFLKPATVSPRRLGLGCATSPFSSDPSARKAAAGLSVLKRKSIARAPIALCFGVGVTRTCVAYNHVLTQSLGWSSLP